MKETKTVEETELLFNSLSPRARKSVHALVCEDGSVSNTRMLGFMERAVKTVFGSGYTEEAHEVHAEIIRLYVAWRNDLVNQQ